MRYRYLSVSIFLIGIALLAIPASGHADDAAKQLLSDWQNSIAHSSRQNMSVTIHKVVIEPVGRDEEITSRIKRSKDWWHISSHARVGNREFVIEVLANDQNVKIQRKPDETNPQNVTGTYRRASDPVFFYQGPVFECAPLFGIVDPHIGLSLPEVMLKHNPSSKRQDGQIEVSSKTPHGDFRVVFDAEKGLPLQIFLKRGPGDIHQGKVIGQRGSEFEKLDSVLFEFRDIVHERRGDQLLPVAWETLFFTKSTDRTLRVLQRVKIEEITLNAGIRARDFRLEVPPAEEQVVIVNDMPVQCVWRKGRIEASVSPDIEGSPGGFRLFGSSGSALLLVTGFVLLVLALFLYVRLRSAG
ncbi:MAG TPA: hypothetical protein PKD54_11550 [Pirellulaceae bacterium]|nr:hypothetical protein [Pirellulaceae bacterium]